MSVGLKMIEEIRSRVRADRAWLSPPDPSTNHNFASSAQHERTASWFFEGHISKEWKSKSTKSFLWIHGKRALFCSFVLSHILISSNQFSGFGEERPLVRHQYLRSLPSNLNHPLALQSSET